MDADRVDALLDECGAYWLGGQREMIRERLLKIEVVAARPQTPHQSMVEALVGTGVGFVVALLSQVFIMWMYDLPATLMQNVSITVFFTGVSIIRGYLVRRYFNWRQHAKTHR